MVTCSTLCTVDARGNLVDFHLCATVDAAHVVHLKKILLQVVELIEANHSWLSEACNVM
jgi:hypothetical protein